jgi:glycine betaine/proline transport system ATP-binding protein
MLTPEDFKKNDEKQSNIIKVNENDFLDEFLPQVCLTPATVEVIDNDGNIKGYITEKVLSKALTKTNTNGAYKS